MLAAVFSDTHGNTALMVEACRRLRPDVIIHLGDCERDTAVLKREFPDSMLCNVAGNCDFGSLAPLKDTVQLGPVKAFITHGHLYNVKYSTDRLVYAAMEKNCKLALYGHTHIADNSEFAGVMLVNPGSSGLGREPSFALIEVLENGGIKAEIRKL